MRDVREHRNRGEVARASVGGTVRVDAASIRVLGSSSGTIDSRVGLDISGQTIALRHHVAHFEQILVEQGPFDADVPVLHVRRLGLGINREDG
jgi:hypothetical protein